MVHIKTKDIDWYTWHYSTCSACGKEAEWRGAIVIWLEPGPSFIPVAHIDLCQKCYDKIKVTE